MKIWIDWLQLKPKKLYKQRLDFPNKKNIETRDTLAIIQGHKLLKQRLDFPNNKKIDTMHTLAIIQGQKFVETTVRFSK